MKQWLITLSSLTTLALASNCALSVVNTTINTNPTDPNKPTWLFNNSFGYLNQDSWITNQATTDNKYYSYDTTHAVGNLSDGTPTRNAFIVDNTGNLIIKPELKLSDIDKNTLNNIQSEMINHKKVTLVKNFYNPYSKSVYSDSYFSGDNSNWKYLQMGGVEKPIDISNQQSANKVTNNTILNESVGLYYIAQATRIPNWIDMPVAENLGKYFISQSSLKNLDSVLINNIINLIVNNDNVYNLMSYEFKNYGLSNLYKNYAMNYIFDSSNNLVEVYCNQWNKDNVEQNVNFNYYDTYNGYSSADAINSPNSPLVSKRTTPSKTILNWKNYANSWSDFVTKYPTLTFGNNSYIDLFIYSYVEGKSDFSNKSLNTKSIDTTTFSTQLFYVKIYKGGSIFTAGYNSSSWIWMWHDNANIYINFALEEYSSQAKYGTQFTVNIPSITFNNAMN